ncbi:hypothetical protein VSDG_02418 [Cytospora chrysosperma]|uniref:Uncharacterized protein n=1 Tax=Cytospora chrysosperma TaxID=252740 RepID=A0A423WG69_CYTCH|nr:hypothetical protein VSDG_02418 [Valsa sordida]
MAVMSLISLLALFALVPPSTSSWSSILLGYEDEGPFGIPISTFKDLISKPNATGAIIFNGSGILSGDNVEYTLRINVTADVPLKDATDDDTDKSNFTVASVISLEGAANNANQSVCVQMFSGLAAKKTAAVHNLSSQDGAGCINGTQPVFFEDVSSPLAKGDKTAWIAAATNIWPVIFATVPDDNSSTLPTQIFLNCIRPDTFSQETARPRGSGSDGFQAVRPVAIMLSLGLGLNIAMSLL